MRSLLWIGLAALAGYACGLGMSRVVPAVEIRYRESARRSHKPRSPAEAARVLPDAHSDPCGELAAAMAPNTDSLRQGRALFDAPRVDRFKELLPKLDAGDPRSALHMADALRSESERAAAMRGFFGKWVDKDAESALPELPRRIAAFDSGPLGNRFIDKIAIKASKGDVAAAAAWANRLPENLRSSAVVFPMFQWMGKDLKAALDWARGNGVPIDREVVTDIYPETLQVRGTQGSPLSVAANNHPVELADWLRTLPDAERERLAEAALSKIRNDDARRKLSDALAR